LNKEDKYLWERYTHDLNLSVYFSHEYVSIISENYANPIKLLKFYNSDSGLITIFTHRIKKNPFQDIFSPYGMDGIYFWGNNIDEVFEEFKIFLKKNNIVTFYLSSHPLYRLQDIFSANTRSAFILDLKIPIDILWKNIHENHRYEINKFNKTKYDIIEDKDELCKSILELYNETMIRVNANSVYRFSENILTNLIKSDISYSVGIKFNNKVQCILIFLGKNNWAEYYINASTIQGKIATRFLIWHSMKKLKELGFEQLNLGGGVTEGDTLQQFKKRFGGNISDFRSIKGVSSIDDYNLICSNYIIDSEESNYFPPYYKNKIEYSDDRN
jgi:hypothetical protein